MHFSPVECDREPIDVLPMLARRQGAAFVHVPDPTAPVTLLGAEPVDELRIDATVATATDPVAAIAAFVGAQPSAGPFPQSGGVIGYLAYELGQWTVPKVALRMPREPLAVLRRYDPLLVFDHTRRTWTRVGERDRTAGEWTSILHEPTPPAPAHANGPLAAAWTAADHAAALARIHRHLVAGDIYQANLTMPFTAPLGIPAWALCQRLARRHPVAYVAYLDLGDAQIVTNSPELFLRVRDDRIETRPIKGTRPRGSDPATDDALAAALAAAEKDRAEHVMIVDLERNDLGRVCAYGSVTVPALMAVERHPSVHHLVSTVTGRLRPDVDLATVLRATFPGGSITGAPKQRAMQILADVEPWPRGAYCGAFGVFGAGRAMELGLAIRTGVVADGTVRWHAGGGIVMDSLAEREWDEAWLKTAALRQALA